jgi:gliding motility-associated-like protein
LNLQIVVKLDIFGYAYVDAGCGILGVASSLCSSDDSALIIAPAGFNTYQWSGPNDDNLILSGETDDSLFVSNPVINDTFYVNMESASGCISEIQTVLEYTTVTVGQLIVNNSCPGGASGNATIIAQGSTQGYNYLWTPGNFTTPTVTNLAPGVYNVHVESIDPACGTLDTFVTIGTNPIIPSQSTSDFCNANSVDIVAPLGSNFQWYNPSGTSIPGPIGINDSINVSGAFDGQNYTVTYLSSTSGCMDSTIITLNQIFPSGVIGGNIGSCGAVNLTYNFADNPTFTYEINGPSYNNVIANTSNNSINLNGLLPGSYVVTVLDGSCLSSSSFDISYTVSNTPINTAICPLGTQTLTSSSSGTHNWTDPNGIQTSTGASQVFTFPTTPPLAGIYTDTTTIISGCIEISVFNVTVTPTVYNPVVDLLPCPLDDFAVTSNSSGTHFWTDPSSGSLGSTTTTTFTINNILEGIYTDSTVTTAGCVVISNYDVTYDTILTNTTNSNIICYGDTNAVATVTVVSGPTGTYSYDWSGPLSYVAIGTSQTDLFAGTFIIYTENGNCNTTDTIVITSPSMPNDTLEITGAFCTYDPNATLFGPEGFTNYQWYFNNTPIIGENEDSIVISNLLQYTGYSVSYDTPPNGCTRFTTFINRTNTGPLFLPSVYNNVFTPNSDNVNEKYFPFYSTDFSIAEIQYYTEEFTFNVYNRWGELMYTSNSYSEGWDGKTNGKECSEGVYYWSLYFNPHCDDEASQITEVTGTVHLMR